MAKIFSFLKTGSQGQTLIEFLVALGAAVAVLSAIGSAVLTSLNNAQFSKNQNLANQFANQGMEIMRKIRSSDPSAFSLLEGAYCLDKDQTSLSAEDKKNPITSPGCSKGIGSPNQNTDRFAREVNIEQNSSDCTAALNVLTKIAVSVSWADSKCTGVNPFCHSVKLVSCLSKTQTIPAP